MKVLLVSLFHPELVRGGAQQVCYELFAGLKDRTDVDVTLLASVDQSFPALHKSGARIVGFERRESEYLFLSRQYDHWWHKVSDPLLVEGFVEFLLTLRPDVVHFHHFLTFGIDLLTLTRRVLPEARIVFTLHEFLTICAADGQMVRKSDRSLCEVASPVRCHQCFPERAPELFFMRELWMKRHLDAVDVFTTPSRFMIEHFVKWGIDRKRIVQVTNGQSDYNREGIEAEARERRNRFGFFGQMVDNKGIHVILQAVQILRSEGFTGFTVEINGDNLRYASEARRAEIERFLDEERARPYHEQLVLFNGSYQPQQIGQRMARVDWCIVPSVWWEIFGLVISEAWMFKRPVIASGIGGMAERITHELDGLHFAVGDPRSLAATIRRACTEEGLWERLVSGIRPPPAREVMVDGFVGVYAARPDVRKAA